MERFYRGRKLQVGGEVQTGRFFEVLSNVFFVCFSYNLITGFSAKLMVINLFKAIRNPRSPFLGLQEVGRV